MDSPRPPALPTLVQYHCTIIGQYMTSPPNSHLYAMHHTILAITISCKGQGIAPFTPALQQPARHPRGTWYLAIGARQVKRLTGHTHSPTENNTPNTHTHDKNNTPNPQTNTPHKHLTLEGGATTVRATSHARVGGCAKVSVGGRVEVRRPGAR